MGVSASVVVAIGVAEEEGSTVDGDIVMAD